jgi:hypothetical protein
MCSVARQQLPVVPVTSEGVGMQAVVRPMVRVRMSGNCWSMRNRRRDHRALLLALVLLLSACVRVDVEGDGEAEDLVIDDGGDTEEPVVEDPDEGEDLEVELEVVEGPEGSILAFVPVMIQGQGPYAFALDTGASSSVIDERIAEELELEQVGEEQGVTGVTGATEAVSVQIEEWNLDGVDLGARPAIVLDLGGDEDDGPGLEGLLGSDVLSAFGAITVDYDAGLLILRPREDASS